MQVTISPLNVRLDTLEGLTKECEWFITNPSSATSGDHHLYEHLPVTSVIMITYGGHSLISRHSPSPSQEGHIRNPGPQLVGIPYNNYSQTLGREEGKLRACHVLSQFTFPLHKP